MDRWGRGGMHIEVEKQSRWQLSTSGRAGATAHGGAATTQQMKRAADEARSR